MIIIAFKEYIQKIESSEMRLLLSREKLRRAFDQEQELRCSTPFRNPDGLGVITNIAPFADRVKRAIDEKLKILAGFDERFTDRKHFQIGGLRIDMAGSMEDLKEIDQRDIDQVTKSARLNGSDQEPKTASYIWPWDEGRTYQLDLNDAVDRDISVNISVPGRFKLEVPKFSNTHPTCAEVIIPDGYGGYAYTASHNVAYSALRYIAEAANLPAPTVRQKTK